MFIFFSLFFFLLCCDLYLLAACCQLVGTNGSRVAGPSEAHTPATLAAPCEGRPWVILCFTCGLRFLLFATREHGSLNILLKKTKKAVTWCLLMNCKLALRVEIFIFQFI